ncbi:hypothetical protein GQ53DRAFT_330680 [Thozetella sp. PMI_491]|nr:hypothetical protein GQ53DRAFT_330680 [Thozetella sp. PMI_491]
MSQPTHPTLINIPQAPSNPDTPEMPGTPTSTTTSLSALSTTAIKDGHRGHAQHGPAHRGHQHNLSTNSLEAERADRISRLAGLSSVSTLRGPPGTQNAASSPQVTPTSSGFPVTSANAPGGLTPAYFDSNGQPVAATKMSTVGTASATESIAARTTTEMGDENNLQDGDGDEDMLSMDTNYRTEVDSASGYMGGDDRLYPMDEDLATRSVGGFEDRMSDDGSASLVGFGEGAGSTVSGPIYHRRPLPNSSAGAMANVWGLERSSSGLSDGAMQSTGQRRDTVRGPGSEREAGSDTPISITAALERREARMMDGVAMEPSQAGVTGATSDDVFVDTTTRGPIPLPPTSVVQPNLSAIRETQQPHSYQQQQARQQQQQQGSTSREAAERIVRERLDNGEGLVGTSAMISPKGAEKLGRFYFEDGK